MSAGRTARRTPTAALGLAALWASACVEPVVVGTQPSPITSLDGGEDAQQPEPDAALDAQPPAPDAAPDTAPPQPDAATPDSGPADASADDDGPVVVLVAPDAEKDAGCGLLGCAPDAGGTPDAGKLGPCACAPVTITVAPDGRFPTCDDEVCWENPDKTCTMQCPPNPTCNATADCEPDEYCYFPRNDCGKSSVGFCVPRPTGSCDGIGNPVCGCDERTYQNGCYAQKAGVAIATAAYARCAPDGGS